MMGFKKFLDLEFYVEENLNLKVLDFIKVNLLLFLENIFLVLW